MEKIIDTLKADPKKYLTTEDYLKKVECFDSALFIIGIVKECKTSEVCVDKSTGRTGQVVNFTLEGAEDFLIYLCAWEENVEKVTAVARQDNIIMVEGAFAKVHSSNYTPDGRNFLLTVRGNTTLHLLEKNNHDENAEEGDVKEAMTYQSVKEIMDSAEHNDLITIDLYLSRNFRYQSVYNSFGICVVRDKYHSLNLLVTNYYESKSGTPNPYKIGDKLRILANVVIEDTGIISLNGSFRDISRVDEDAGIFRALARATSPGKKIKFESDTNNGEQ